MHVPVIEVCPACSFLVNRDDSDTLLPAHIDVRRGTWCIGTRQPTLRARLRHLVRRWASAFRA